MKLGYVSIFVQLTVAPSFVVIPLLFETTALVVSPMRFSAVLRVMRAMVSVLAINVSYVYSKIFVIAAEKRRLH